MDPDIELEVPAPAGHIFARLTSELPFLFYDDFSSGLGKWQNLANASVINGALEIENSGESFQSAVGADWTDYSFRVDMTPLFAAGGSLVFRKQDNNNLYMWQFNTDGVNPDKLRPHKRVGGAWTVLKEVPYNLTLNTTYDVEIRCLGSTIETRVNGVLIDTTFDTAHTSGRIGFRHNNTDRARYDNVRVIGR